MRRIRKIIAWILGVSITLAAIVITAISIWAITGPRDVSKYTSFIENSLNSALPNNKIKIGRTYLNWGGLDELLSVEAGDVELFDNNQNKIATFPKIVMRFGVTSVITGQLIPSFIKVADSTIDLRNFPVNSGGKSVDLKSINLGKLKHVSVVNAQLILHDASQWHVQAANLWYGDDIVLNARADKADGERINAVLKTDNAQTDGFATAQLTNFDTDSLKYYFPVLAKMHFKVNGNARYDFGTTKNQAEFAVENFTGEFNDPDVFASKLEVKQGNITGGYDFNSNILAVNDMATVFNDGFKVTAKGNFHDANNMDIAASIANLKVDSFKHYWPISASPNVIAWINEHLSGGDVPTASMALKLTPQADGKVAQDMDIKFSFRDVNANYVDNLLPVRNGSGTGEMVGDKLHINVISAQAGDSEIKNGQVEFYDIGAAVEKLQVNVKLEGSAQDVADFYMKLVKGRKVISSKTDLTGKAITDITVKLPLLKTLKMDDVIYDVKSQITDASAKNFLDKLSIDRLKIDLAADNNTYSAKGDCYATYEGQNDTFSLKTAPISYEVSGKDGNLRILFGSDITNSSLAYPKLEINKPIGEPGKLLVEINDNGQQLPALTRFALDSRPIKIAAQGSLTKDYSNFSTLDITGLQFGKTSLVGRVFSSPYITAEFKGDVFDAQPILRHLKSDKQDDTEFKILLQAKQALLMNGETLKNPSVAIHCAKNCDLISINADNVTVNQTGTNLLVKTDNAGALFNAFDLYDNMKGGKLEINGSTNADNYEGKITITDFSITKAHVLTKMLTLGSLTGIADTLQGNGISFKKLVTNVSMDKHTIKIKDFRMVGAAVGVTGGGTIDRDKNTADVAGYIIPAYTANTLLGKIPLIGPVIIGDEGVFALAYSLSGNTDDPSVSVNPLSFLAPGFLKNVFQ